MTSVLNPLGLSGLPLVAAWLLPGIPPPGPFGMIPLSETTFVENGVMSIIGLATTPVGVSPYHFRSKVPPDVADCFIDRSNNANHPAVQKVLKASEGPISFGVEKGQIEKSVENLVERARLGDQNAVAIITQMRVNAKKGVELAKLSMAVMKDYIDRNPAGNPYRPARFGGVFSAMGEMVQKCGKTPMGVVAAAVTITPIVTDSVTAQETAASILADKPLPNTTLKIAGEASGAGEAFRMGYSLSGDQRRYQLLVDHAPEEKKFAVQMGYTLGVAKRIQAARDPDQPISKLSKVAGWENGEGEDSQ